MRIQNDLTTTSSKTTLAARRNASSTTSFQDVLDHAANRFVNKLSSSSTSRESSVDAISSSALMQKLAEVQTTIDEANAKGAQPGSTASISSATNGQASSASSQIYNEGKLCCSDELNAYFLEASQVHNIDAKLLKAVAFVESSFRADATSKCGAMGIMQLMPSAAKQYGAEDAYDARQNIMAGAKILSTFLKRYDGDVSLTLAAYNAGPGNVKKAGGVPSYTEGYINKVLKYYNA